MSIWILAFVLLGVVAALGYLQGALRTSISLFGLFLGAVLAFPLSFTAKPVMGWFGVKHPIWSWFWPPLIVFAVIWLLFVGISFFAHGKVNLYYKYQSDDLSRLRWERLNKHLGLCLGLVMGGVWLGLISLMVYVAGYLTLQVTSDETASPALVRFVNQARRDLQSTGLDRAIAAFDRTPSSYYQVSDLLGLVYQNPMLTSRLAQYPPFLTLAERTEIQEISTDAEFNNLLLSKGDFTAMVKHPKAQAIIYNPEIVQFLLGQDLKDLWQFLETGKSPKFDDEKILGRWQLDSYSTLTQWRKKNPNIPASKMANMRKAIMEMIGSGNFVATTDNKADLKVEESDKLKQLKQAAAPKPPATEPDSSGARSSTDPYARYGGRGPSGTGPRPPGQSPTVAPAPAPAPAIALPTLLIPSGQGTWQRNGDKYQLKLDDGKGKTFSMAAEADDEKLLLQIPPPLLTAVFVRVD